MQNYEWPLCGHCEAIVRPLGTTCRFMRYLRTAPGKAIAAACLVCGTTPGLNRLDPKIAADIVQIRNIQKRMSRNPTREPYFSDALFIEDTMGGT